MNILQSIKGNDKKITEAFNVNPSQVDKNDPIEKSVYDQCKKIGSGGNATGTIIWNWYQKDKRNLQRSELEHIYGSQFKEILDKLSLYDNYCKSLDKDYFKVGNFDFKIKNNEGLLKLRSVKGLETVLNRMNELINGSSTGDKTFDQNFTMDENDKKNIRFLGSTENLICFVTKNYKSTNKFIYGIWRNSNMNSPYGHPEENSPFCTRMSNHWQDYSDRNANYEQFWIFLKPNGQIPSNQGDLTDQNVENLYRSMSRKGNDLLVGLLDTYNDCNTRDDETVDFPKLDFKDKNGVDRTEETISMMGNLFFTDSLEVEHIYSKKTNFNWKEELNKAIGLAKEKLIRLLENGKGIDDLSHGHGRILKRYLTSIDIPNSVTSIGNYAFFRCKSLTSINIPNSVTSIEDDAFTGCISLTSINIPNSVTSIGNDVFYGCVSLTSIVVSEDSEVYDQLVKEYGDIVKTKESSQLNECQHYWIRRFITN